MVKVCWRVGPFRGSLARRGVQFVILFFTADHMGTQDHWSDEREDTWCSMITVNSGPRFLCKLMVFLNIIEVLKKSDEGLLWFPADDHRSSFSLSRKRLHDRIIQTRLFLYCKYLLTKKFCSKVQLHFEILSSARKNEIQR